MTARSTPVAFLLLGMALITSPAAHAAAPPDPAAKTRVEIARTAYFRLLTDADYRLTAPAPGEQAAVGARTALELVFDGDLAERLHTWSCRWKDAQADGEATPDGKLAALDAHLARMKALAEGTVKLPDDPAAPRAADADDPFGDLNLAIRDLGKLDTMTKEERQGLTQSGDLEAFLAGVRFFHLEAQAWRAQAQASATK